MAARSHERIIALVSVEGYEVVGADGGFPLLRTTFAIVFTTGEILQNS